MEVKAPEWFRKAKIYQIFVDRFAGSITGRNRPDFMGGTIRGIINQLDYLSQLGINTLWLSPFYQTTAYHGYHITDYFKVDEHFGTLADVIELIQEAHSRNLKIIADFVPNHCSKHHPYFKEATLEKKSIYNPWFYFHNWPNDYLCFMRYGELPKINLNHEPAYEHINKAAKHWLSLGFDGYRIDHAIGPSHKFWNRFYADIKKDYPNCVLIGEVWGQGFSPKLFKTIGIKHKTIRRITGLTQESLQHEYIGVLDAVFDFKLNNLLIQGVKKGVGFSKRKSFNQQVKHHLNKYPNDYLVTFLDNHDMNRFMLHCNNNFELLLETVEFLLSINRPLVLYYGTEIGMTQTKPFSDQSHTDLLARAPFNWKRYSKKRVAQMAKLLNANQ